MVQFFLLKMVQKVNVGTKIADWDANNKVLLTEHAGFVKFVDLVRNMTYQEVMMKQHLN